MADLIQFDEPSGRRIARVVRTVEGMGPRAKPLVFDPIIELRRGSSGSSSLRLCKTTAAWDKGTITTLDLYENGEPPSETSSGTLAGCVKRTQNVPAGKFVLVGRAAGGRWYLINAECG